MHSRYDASPAILKTPDNVPKEAIQEWIVYEALKRELNEREKKYNEWHDTVNEPDAVRWTKTVLLQLRSVLIMKGFATTLLRWYDAHGRDLPWRKTRDPYRILLAEIMLQQTQVSRVIDKWEEWLKRFPTAHSLAQASKREVLLAWQGMGYNNRAVRLKQCCEHVAMHGWQQDPKSLQRLPGIGRYTAHAIACFAFGKRVPVVDINVRLVYAPFIGAKASDKETWAYAEKILPRERYYDYNQALFDLGTVVRSGNLSSLPQKFQRLYQGTIIKRKRPKETLYGGYPLRLYRGALVQFLRERKNHKATIGSCREHLASRLSRQDHAFIRRITQNLARDGIVSLNGDRVTLA